MHASGPAGSNEVLVSTKDGLQVMHTTKGSPLSGPMPTISREAAFSPDRRRVAAISADARQCTVYLWDRAGDSSPLPPLGHSVASVAYSSNGDRLVTGSLWYGTVRTWNTATGQALSPPISHPPGCLAGFSPNDAEIVTIGSDRTVRRHDALTGVQRGSNLEYGCEHPRSVRWSYSHDGDRLVLISVSPSDASTTSVQGWDLKTDKPLWVPFSSGYRGFHLTMNPRTDVFAIAGSSGYARLYDSLNGKPRSPELKHDYFVSMPAFSADGQLLATPSGDKLVRLWDVTTGELRGQLVHDEVVNVVAFTPDGKLLVSGSKLGARVWNVETQQPLGSVIQPGEDINTVKISPDGRFALLAHGHELRVWEIRTGEPAGPPLPFGTVAAEPKFHPQGTQIAYTAGDATGAISQFSPDERSLEQLQQCTALLTGKQLDTWGTLQSLPRAEMLALWKQYAERYPAERTVPTQQARAWQRRLAARSQFETESAAALVVLKQCLVETPDDLQLRSVLAEAAVRTSERNLAVDALIPVVGAGQASLLDWYFLEVAYPEDLTIRWKNDVFTNADRMTANPGNPHLTHLQGWLAAKRDPSLALEGFDLAIGNGARGKVLSQRARLLCYFKRWTEARDALIMALEFDRSEQDIWQGLIYVYLAMEDEAAAQAAMARYADQFAYSDDVLALNWLAWLDCIYVHQDPQKAKQRAERSLQTTPRRDSWFTTLAVAHLRCGEFELAKQKLEIARAAAGGAYSGSELLMLALIQHHLKLPDEARATLQKARDWREPKPHSRTWQQQIDFARLLQEVEPLVDTPPAEKPPAETKPKDETKAKEEAKP